MKKIIGIVLALCMLFTMASAAAITDATAPEVVNPTEGVDTMTVAITYAGLESTAQATMLAYKVADTATAAAIPAFESDETTPIVGIDQDLADGTFEFKVASTFRGKVAVMIGGDDVTTPVSMLVEFKDATVTPDPGPEEPGTGGEGGEGGDDTEYVEITFIWGDVNSDNVVDAKDGSAIVSTLYGGEIVYGNYTIGAVIATTDAGVDIIWGDINGDDVVDAKDGSAIVSTLYGGEIVYGDYTIGSPVTFNVPKA